MELIPENEYEHLLAQISETYQQGQQNAAIAVNSHLVETYWRIGEQIVVFEQGGNAKAEYGKALLPNLSKDLNGSFGKVLV